MILIEEILNFYEMISINLTSEVRITVWEFRSQTLENMNGWSSFNEKFTVEYVDYDLNVTDCLRRMEIKKFDAIYLTRNPSMGYLTSNWLYISMTTRIPLYTDGDSWQPYAKHARKMGMVYAVMISSIAIFI